MADEMDIVRSVVSGAMEMPHVASPAVADPQNAETFRKAEELQELQARIQFRITQINADPNLSTEDKMTLVARLEGALSSGDPNGIVYILNSVLSNAQIARNEEYADQTLDEAYHLDSSGYGYDPKSRLYMNRLWQEALSTPELQAMMREVNALPPAEKELAEQELRKNWIKSKEMLADEKLKPYHEQIEIMRGMGLLHSKEAAGILANIQSGESVEEISHSVNALLKKKVEAAQPVINSHVSRIPEPSQQFLKSNFGKEDGTIDAEKLMKEWARTKPKERDEAYKAMVSAGNDISKLPLPQQRIIHMSQVMIAVDGASVAKGTLEIVARNKEAAKYLSDTSIDPKIREQRLGELLKEAGVSPSERAAYQESLEQAIRSLDDMTKKGVNVASAPTAQIASSFVAEYKENMLEVAGHKPSQADVRRVDNAIDAANAGETSYNYADSMRFITAAKADMDIPEWAKADAERRAQFEASQTEWKAIEERLKSQEQQRFAEANGVTPDLPAAATAGQNDAQITASTAEFMKEYQARTAQPQAEATVAAAPAPTAPSLGAQASEVVATVVSPPPGIDPKTLPPLTSLGVTGGTSVAEPAAPTGGKVAQQGVEGPSY